MTRTQLTDALPYDVKDEDIPDVEDWKGDHGGRWHLVEAEKGDFQKIGPGTYRRVEGARETLKRVSKTKQSAQFFTHDTVNSFQVESGGGRKKAAKETIDETETKEEKDGAAAYPSQGAAR